MSLTCEKDAGRIANFRTVLRDMYWISISKFSWSWIRINLHLGRQPELRLGPKLEENCFCII